MRIKQQVKWEKEPLWFYRKMTVAICVAWFQVWHKFYWIHISERGVDLNLLFRKTGSHLDIHLGNLSLQPFAIFLHVFSLNFSIFPFFLKKISQLRLIFYWFSINVYCIFIIYSDRLGHVINSDTSEQSPLLLLFLDCTWQLLQQFPDEFEFSETFLTTLWDSAFLPIFDTFLFNSEHDRQVALRKVRFDELSLYENV